MSDVVDGGWQSKLVQETISFASVRRAPVCSGGALVRWRLALTHDCAWCQYWKDPVWNLWQLTWGLAISAHLMCQVFVCLLCAVQLHRIP